VINQDAASDSQLDEKGLWSGDYPLDESQAAEMIEKHLFSD